MACVRSLASIGAESRKQASRNGKRRAKPDNRHENSHSACGSKRPRDRVLVQEWFLPKYPEHPSSPPGYGCFGAAAQLCRKHRPIHTQDGCHDSSFLTCAAERWGCGTLLPLDHHAVRRLGFRESDIDFYPLIHDKAWCEGPIHDGENSMAHRSIPAVCGQSDPR